MALVEAQLRIAPGEKIQHGCGEARQIALVVLLGGSTCVSFTRTARSGLDLFAPRE
jgi:hypothetical protein